MLLTVKFAESNIELIDIQFAILVGVVKLDHVGQRTTITEIVQVLLSCNLQHLLYIGALRVVFVIP